MGAKLCSSIAVALAVGAAGPASGVQSIDWDGAGKQRQIVDLNDEVEIARIRWNWVAPCPLPSQDDPVAGPACADVVLVPAASIQQGVYGTPLPANGLEVCSNAPSPEDFEVFLGRIRPLGAVAPGRYAVVIDECQDGVYRAEDAVFEPALDVVPPWPMEGRLPGHDARGRVKGPIAAPAVTWDFVKDSAVGTPSCCARSSPVLSSDDVLYVGNNGGQLWAFRASDGLPLWAFATTPPDFISSPALGLDGTVYFGSRNGTAYAITPAPTQTGATLKWSRSLHAPGENGSMIGGPVLRMDGSEVVYFATQGGQVHALDAATGVPAFTRFNTGSTIYETPALGADGAVYVGNFSGRVVALNPNLTERWASPVFSSYETTQTCPGLPLPAFVSSPTWSPQGGGAGTVYVGMSLLCGPHGHFIALDADDGSIEWVYPAHPDVNGLGFDGGAAVAPGGTIYAGGALIQGGATFRYLFGFSALGAVLEQVPILGTIREGPILGRDGTVYAATENFPSVVAVRSGDVLWTHPPPAAARPRPALGVNDTLYFASDDGQIVALGGSPIVQVRALEVAQAVQNWRNEIPLTSDKATWVRAHLESMGPTQMVRGCLRGFVGGVELSDSPLTAQNVGGELVVWSDYTAAEARSVYLESLNFRLPASWTLPGPLELRLERQAEAKTCAELRSAPDPADPDFACAEPEEPGLGAEPHDCSVNVSFAPVPAPLVHYVAIDWTDALGIQHVLGGSSLAEIHRKVAATLPVEDFPLTITSHFTWPGSGAAPSDQDALPRIARLRRQEGCFSVLGCNEYYQGIVPGRVASGLAYRPGSAGVAGFDGAWDNGRYTPPHELGHSLGMWHAHSRVLDLNGNGVLDHVETGKVHNVCDIWNGIGASKDTLIDPPPDFPFVFEMDGSFLPIVSGGGKWTALLGAIDRGDDRLFGGIDSYPTGTATPSDPIDVLNPLLHTEIMSYCHLRNPGSWPEAFSSAYYLAIRDTLLSAAGVAGAAPAGDSVTVSGTVDLVSGAATLDRLSRVEGPADAATPGSYAIEVRDGAGALLSSVAFEPISPADSGDVQAHFAIGVPFSPAARQVQLRRDGTAIVTRTASANAPTVAVLSPNGGEMLTDATATLSWAAADADGDSLTYVVQYSPDGGASWQTLSADYPNTTLTIARTRLSGSSDARIRVKAEDGFHSVRDASDAAFSVANAPPTLAILAPGKDQLFVGDQRIDFEARALDREQGRLPAGSFTWSSSLDGSLGAGASLARAASTLSEGAHTITVVGTDSAGGQDQASVGIQVLRELPDTDDDGFPDVYDNCPAFQNPTQADDDRDGIGDACDDVTAVADLRITKSDAPDPVAPGGQVDYALAVTNLGPDAAQNVEIVDQAPASFGILGVLISGAFTQANCGYTGSTFTCAMGNLASGASGTLTLRFATSTQGVVTNSASVSSDAADPIVTNDSDSETTTVSLDSDLDGVGDIADNCPTVANANQANFDGDMNGDACDACETIVDLGADSDMDGVDDACDTCTSFANPPVAGVPSANRSFISHQRDDDTDGRGNRCDFDYNNLGPVLTSTDFNDMKFSLLPSPGLVTQSNCGATVGAAPAEGGSGANQRCGEFDHDGNGPALTSADFNLAKAAIAAGGVIATNFPKCASCTQGSGWSNTLGPGARLGRPVCQSAVAGACVYAP